MSQFFRVIVEIPGVWYPSGSEHRLMLDFFHVLTIHPYDLDFFCINIVAFHFCSQSYGQASLCLAVSGQDTQLTGCLKQQSDWEKIQPKFSASGAPHSETPDRPNTPELVLLERWWFIFKLPNCSRLWILTQKANKKTRKYLMTLCFSMTTNIIYDPLCNDMSIIHWKAVFKDIVNKHFWFANRKPEILLWKLKGWG